MMQFLLENGFSQELIDKLVLKYDEGIIDVFQIEKYNVLENIKYFKEIGIHNIEDLLLFRMELFIKDPEEIQEAFESHNIDEIVKEINEDFLNIDKV